MESLPQGDHFDEQLKTTAVLFKALSHPARLTIIKYLAGIRVCMTGDISDQLPLSRTTVKQHLSSLKKAGLIQGSVDGVKVNYCLDPKGIAMLERCFGDFTKMIHHFDNITCKD